MILKKMSVDDCMILKTEAQASVFFAGEFKVI
jgi:hypothetical protein